MKDLTTTSVDWRDSEAMDDATLLYPCIRNLGILPTELTIEFDNIVAEFGIEANFLLCEALFFRKYKIWKQLALAIQESPEYWIEVTYLFPAIF